MSSENERRARLLALKDAIRSYFDGAAVSSSRSADPWLATFRALRGNDYLAEGFIEGLRKLVEYIEREYGHPSQATPVAARPDASAPGRRESWSSSPAAGKPGFEEAHTPPTGMLAGAVSELAARAAEHAPRTVMATERSGAIRIGNAAPAPSSTSALTSPPPRRPDRFRTPPLPIPRVGHRPEDAARPGAGPLRGGPLPTTPPRPGSGPPTLDLRLPRGTSRTDSSGVPGGPGDDVETQRYDAPPDSPFPPRRR